MRVVTLEVARLAASPRGVYLHHEAGKAKTCPCFTRSRIRVVFVKSSTGSPASTRKLASNSGRSSPILRAGKMAFGVARVHMSSSSALENTRSDRRYIASGTASGAFDPASEIIPRAKAAGAWVHVDGAFGLWAAAAPDRAHLVQGYAAADSWAIDAHKWLNVPYDSGIVIVRDPRDLYAAMAVNAPYLVIGETREPEHYTPEFSRRARGFEVWAALRSLGRQGLADLIERTCRHATRFAEGLREAGYDILNDVVINQVLVSFGDAELTRRVIAAIQAEGTCWAGATVWQGHTAMRISGASWATTDEDVERSLEAMIRVAGDISRSSSPRPSL